MVGTEKSANLALRNHWMTPKAICKRFEELHNQKAKARFIGIVFGDRVAELSSR